MEIVGFMSRFSTFRIYGAGVSRQPSPARVHRVQNEVFRVEARGKATGGNRPKRVFEAGKWA